MRSRLTVSGEDHAVHRDDLAAPAFTLGESAGVFASTVYMSGIGTPSFFTMAAGGLGLGSSVWMFA